MKAHEAVRAAKSYVLDMFGEEGVTNLGLEEVELEENSHTWLVTVGFSRPWNAQPNPFSALARDGSGLAQRSYKLVRVEDLTGAVLSIRNREVAA